MGLNVARLAGDRSVLGVRRGKVLTELARLPRGTTMQTAVDVVGHLRRLAAGDMPNREPWRPGPHWFPSKPPRFSGAGTVVVDEVGVGAGVFDRRR